MLADGREAIALIRAGTTYDLIFCDLMMPNMSGSELYQSSRRSTRPRRARSCS